MNSFIAAAYLIINFGFYDNASAVQVPMPSMEVCTKRLEELFKVNPTAISYAMCIPTDPFIPMNPTKGLW